MNVNTSERYQLAAQETRLLLRAEHVRTGPSPGAPPRCPAGEVPHPLRGAVPGGETYPRSPFAGFGQAACNSNFSSQPSSGPRTGASSTSKELARARRGCAHLRSAACAGFAPGQRFRAFGSRGALPARLSAAGASRPSPDGDHAALCRRV